MSRTDHVYATCRPTPDGFRCAVRVGDDDGATRHEVTVRHEDLGRFAFDAADPEQLVRESFRFLLEREPRESILARFDLAVIGKYFGEYPVEIRRRMGAASIRPPG